jgi:DsbC/DsbD-like thiol-disulfide interchange protein
MVIVSRTLWMALAGLIFLAGPALAEGASRWQQGFHSRVRLVSGGLDLAGIEIVLDEGFKTYWRQPGESGLPPRFDWTGSDNLAAADLAWPAPTRTLDAGGVAYSYKERVVFPVRITAVNPAKPVKLKLTAEYGVCKDICIPARAELTLALGRGTRNRPLVEEALARVPRPKALGAEGPLAVLGIEPAPGERPTYTVRVRSPADAALFAEGPENWYLSTSTLQGDRFTVIVEEKPKDAGAAPLRLTLVAGAEAIETEVHLDGNLRPR